MPRRPRNIFCALAGINSAVFSLCYILLLTTPSAGPEGIGKAIIAYVCIFFSLILSSIGINQLYSERKQRMESWTGIASNLLALLPLLVFLVFDILIPKIKSAH